MLGGWIWDLSSKLIFSTFIIWRDLIFSSVLLLPFVLESVLSPHTLNSQAKSSQVPNHNHLQLLSTKVINPWCWTSCTCTQAKLQWRLEPIPYFAHANCTASCQPPILKVHPRLKMARKWEFLLWRDHGRSQGRKCVMDSFDRDTSSSF